eukprot:TRINITY_DN6902_c0_g2_i8.p1 TRINITY_DN6902_c0_g2~~TRINITY_DN6902_c0_g2_i8.p1  ORF type:complete len:621 (+),score=85.46 TRINITY_DN6902_c0_g2_i8:103-1965(+)
MHERRACSSGAPDIKYDDGYVGWSLLSSDGSVGDGVSYVRADHRGSFRQPTAILQKGGAFDSLLQRLEAIGIFPARVRLMRLRQKFRRGLGMGGHRRWRLHVPIATNADSMMEWRLQPSQEHHRIHFPANGSIWAVRVDLLHRAVVSENLKDRVHLLMDVALPSSQLLEDPHPVCSCSAEWLPRKHSEMCQFLPQAVVALHNVQYMSSSKKEDGVCRWGRAQYLTLGQELRADVTLMTRGLAVRRLRLQQLWFDPSGHNWTAPLMVEPGFAGGMISGTAVFAPGGQMQLGAWRLLVVLGSAILAEATFRVIDEHSGHDVATMRGNWRGGVERWGYVDVLAPTNIRLKQFPWDWIGNKTSGSGSPLLIETSHIEDGGFLIQCSPVSFCVVSFSGILELETAAVSNASILSTPCLLGGTAVAASVDGAVHAFSVVTATLLWHARLGDVIGSSPLCFNDKVYVTFGFNDGRGGIAALAASSGNLLWQDTVRMQEYSWSSPTLDSVADSLIVGTRGGCLHAFTTAIGSHKWSFCLGAATLRSTSITRGAISVALGIVYFGTCDGRVIALATQTGTLRWQRLLGNRRCVAEVSVAPPELEILGRAAAVVVAAGDKEAVALDAITG